MYQITPSGVRRVSDGLSIPSDPQNLDYQDYLKWAKTNTAETYSFVAAEPEPVCTPAQGLVALYTLKGITEQDVLDAIAAIPDAAQRYTTQIGYGRATEWRRSSPTMQALARLLSLSDADLDALYAHAAQVLL